MFSNTFYPTPKWLAKKMIAPLDLSNAYVLEPSAGKGDILDAIAETYDRYRKPNLYAIEIEPELRSILEGKGYPVIGTDFLLYEPRIHFTHIIANFPFKDAEDHLLYAWNLLYEGEIVCLMNATSLDGKTAKEKMILNLIEDHGSVEKVGQAFAQGAERHTDAEVVIVRLTKKANGSKFDFDVSNDREDPEFDDGKGQEVALTGFIANLLASFEAALGHYADYNRTRQDVLRYIGPFGSYYDDEHGKSVSVMDVADEKQSPKDRHNTFVALLQESAWTKILSHPGFQAILTERARNMMKEFRARQKRVDFNEANIKAMFEALMLKKDEIMTGAVLDAFDTMTAYHEDNRVYFEGWKSNKAWKVSRKVVLPYYIDHWSTGTFHLDYRRLESLNDIDRAMCVVSKRAYDDITTMPQALEISFRNHPGWSESTFFELRYYKKGTLHIKFKDEALWNDFNLAAARGRNWLPPGE